MFISPYYSKPFLIFSFASTHTIIVVLLQRNNEGREQPIAFFIKTLIDAELKYNLMEKKSYAMVKALKYFIFYILHSEIISYVPHIVVKDILCQTDSEGRRGKWTTKIHEYDLEIKDTKLLK